MSAAYMLVCKHDTALAAAASDGDGVAFCLRCTGTGGSSGDLIRPCKDGNNPDCDKLGQCAQAFTSLCRDQIADSSAAVASVATHQRRFQLHGSD